MQGARRTKLNEQKLLAASGSNGAKPVKNSRRKGEEVAQKTFAQKIAGTNNQYTGKTTTSVTPFVPKGVNAGARGQQGRDRTGSSTEAGMIIDGRMKATGRKGNN
jgi:hypothetical protein